MKKVLFINTPVTLIKKVAQLLVNKGKLVFPLKITEETLTVSPSLIKGIPNYIFSYKIRKPDIVVVYGFLNGGILRNFPSAKKILFISHTQKKIFSYKKTERGWKKEEYSY